MKKYLFGFLAVVMAVAFSAFTKPTKNSLVTYYRFAYNTSHGFGETAVETADKAHWGQGAVVANPSAFSAACDPLFFDKACEIIVDDLSVVADPQDNTKKILKTSGTGAVTIIASPGGDLGAFYVDASSTNLDGIANKD